MKRILCKNIIKDALPAIDSGESFSILVNGWRVEKLKKSIPMYRKYLHERELHNERKNTFEVIKFATYAMVTPILWGIMLHAIFSGMTMECYDREEDSLDLIFKK